MAAISAVGEPASSEDVMAEFGAIRPPTVAGPDLQQLNDPAVRALGVPGGGAVGTPASRSLGFVLQGDDGFATRRGMGPTTSSRCFGHPGAGGQVAWADPRSGLSFCFLTNGLDADVVRVARRVLDRSTLAGACAPLRSGSA